METNHMNRRSTNIITRRRKLAILWTTVLALIATTALFAHGGEEHVTGTVTAVSDTSITVKTTAGKVVPVGFDAKTTFARAKKPVQKSEITVGDRIVIHAVEVNEKLVAHTVELGAANTAKH